MKRGWMLLLAGVVIAGLLLGGWWLAQAADAPQPAAYRLETGGLRAVGVSSGGGYRLASAEAPSGSGTPCCCSYLPCIRR